MKFRVKVVHFYDDYYTIKYSNCHGLLWFGLLEPTLGLWHHLEWRPVLGRYSDMKSRAEWFDSIEKVRKFQQAQDRAAAEIRIRAKNYWKSRPPSKTKINY